MFLFEHWKRQTFKHCWVHMAEHQMFCWGGELSSKLTFLFIRGRPYVTKSRMGGRGVFPTDYGQSIIMTLKSVWSHWAYRCFYFCMYPLFSLFQTQISNPDLYLYLISRLLLNEIVPMFFQFLIIYSPHVALLPDPLLVINYFYV